MEFLIYDFRYMIYEYIPVPDKIIHLKSYI
jgi:hypothetical protein